MTKITVPIIVENIDHLRKQAQMAVDGGADILELRLDFWQSPETLIHHVAEIIGIGKSFGLEVLATCRAHWEGGNYTGSEEVRYSILKAAARAGADYIDIELKAAQNSLPDLAPAKTIISYHDFDTMPVDLQDIINSIKAVSSEAIAKIAFKASSITDSFRMLDIMKANPGIIAIAMGYEGIITRLCAGKFNCLLTFAALTPQDATAPGQITLKQMTEIYRVKKCGPETALFGVIGSPISHSRSPEIHNRAFDHSSFNGLYAPLLIGPDDFTSFMDNILARNWLDFRGFSVTIPHKHNALEYIRAKDGHIDPAADAIGAVNTILIDKQGKLSGYNTDYYGALQAMTDGMSHSGSGKQINGSKAAVIGSGGVARAIVAALVDNNAQVSIYNRTLPRAQELAQCFGCKYFELTALAELDADLLINCTSLGMEPDIESCPVDPAIIKDNMVVFDTVYVPLETRLLKYAHQAGAICISGLDMFINQAVKQFELFTGKTAPLEHMNSTMGR
ncbi:MAG: shikimate dehydrogenase [Sedimentisphaerales bacterium]|nr:shikimate dehydrogenase [Sedimentisphaerales bacterium]MBN2842058.1 shikimate dehydrogenase [Sedimentisphaerales bacterium]